MTTIKAGNGPCSWGTLTIEGLEVGQIGYSQMLDELVETGFTGTELGKGCVDFATVTNWLRDREYVSWIGVEQDVLPEIGTPKDSAQRNRAFLRSIGL